MGCWNATCALTHLPIKAGESVVMLMLATLDTVPNQCHYYNEDATLFALPIEGKYDDYGGLEEIQMADETRQMLLNTKFFNHDRGEYVPMSLDAPTEKEIFESLFDQNLYIKYPMVGGLTVRFQYTPITYVMYHKEAFKLVYKEVGGRSTANGKGWYSDALRAKLQRNWDKNLVAREKYTRLMGKALEDMKNDPETDAQGVIDLLEVYTPVSPVWDGMAFGYKFCVAYEEAMWNNKDLDSERFLTDLVNLVCFCVGLDLLRMSFFGICGLGSQSGEMYLHKILSEWALQHIEDSLDADETELSLKERLYIWD